MCLCEWWLLFGKDILPKDWIVGGMVVVQMLVGDCVQASVSRRRQRKEASSCDACPSEDDLPRGEPTLQY